MFRQLDKTSILEFAKGLQNMGSAFVAQDSSLRADIKELSDFVKEAMLFEEAKGTIWYDQADAFMKTLQRRDLDAVNMRFNQKNGYPMPPIVVEGSSGVVDVNQMPPGNISPVGDNDRHALAKLEQELNTREAGFGEEMDEAALAEFFREQTPAPKGDRLKKPLNKMSIKEIEEWEEEQNSATDIYKISARVKNLARGESGRSLGNQQEMLCNSFCHVLKVFYDFADTLPKDQRKKLVQLTMSQEGVPANLISAAAASVNVQKKK